MRRCIVDKCTNSDNIILCHRFPKNRGLAQKWQMSLNLTDCPLDTLVSKYTVCCLHFDRSDYRNSLSNSLNATALPKLECVNPRPHTAIRKKSAPLETQNRSPSDWTEFDKEYPSLLTASDSIELLHRDDSDSITEIDDNLLSPLSSNNEICILPEEPNSSDDLIDGAGFTILDAASCGMFVPTVTENQQQDASDESSALVLQTRDSSGDPQQFRPGSTDSDVEVLVSEAVFESHWSETDRRAEVQNKEQTNASDTTVSPCISYQSDLSTKTHETGFDFEYGHLNNFQLIQLIKKQSLRIQQLENNLATFKSAQEQLFAHFDAFRNSVSDVHP